MKRFNFKLIPTVLFFISLIGAAPIFNLDAHAASKFRGVGLDSATSGADIDLLKTWNVNLVYYFIDPNIRGIATDEAGYLANLDAELAIFDDRLAQFSAKGIKVALNLYGSPGEFVTRKAPSLHRVFAEQWCQTALKNAWKVIAARYKGNSNIWGFNLLNEPAQASVASGLLKWNELSVEIVDAIRNIDSDVRIIIQPPYGNPDKIGSLPAIKNKGTVVYSFNGYAPYNFTHQGLYGIKRGLKFPTDRNNATKLKQYLSRGFKFATKNKVPLFVPEFTVVRWAPSGSGARYLKAMIKLLESNNVDWTYHAFYGAKIESGDSKGQYAYPWSLTHSGNLKDRNQTTKDTDRLKVLKSFFKKNK